MADYKALIDGIDGNLFANQLPGLTVDLVIRYYVSAGVYDVDEDTTTTVYEDLIIPNVVKARTSFEDVRDRGAILNTTKFIVPGQTITREFDTSVDRVIMDFTLVNGVPTGGKEVNVMKVVGVPGDFIHTVYVNR